MAAEGFRLCRPASAVATLWPGARLHAAQHASASGGWPLAGTRARCDDSAADDMRARIQQPESRDVCIPVLAGTPIDPTNGE